MSTVLLTGGLGYIGSHTAVALAGAGCRLVIVDNLSNAKASVLERLRELAPGAPIDFHRVDVRDAGALRAILTAQPIDAVVHFAGLKAVGESVEKPALYREVNVGGTANLLDAMEAGGVRRIVFSSSATVYGEPEHLPYREDHPKRPASPYGATKLAVEDLLAERSDAGRRFRYAALRYFNPIGAHPSARIGEDPRGIPNNLAPYIVLVAGGKLPQLRVFGADYPTADGTAVRDYIHVMDLAAGHMAALRHLEEKAGSFTLNLGTGHGHSVLEVVRAFERACGKPIALQMTARRPGDIAAYWADPAAAAAKLGWKAGLGLDAMCRDHWRWQSQNPDGYPDQTTILSAP
jgi:UDP-glucose 4-epimerase